MPQAELITAALMEKVFVNAKEEKRKLRIKEAKTIETEANDKYNFIYYSNSKYNYSTPYVSDWKIGEEPPAGDGITLYSDNGNEITTYAGYMVFDEEYLMNLIEEDMVNIKKESIKTYAGIDGTLIQGDEDGKRKLHFLVIHNDKSVNLRVKADEEFINENKEILLAMVRGIQIR